MTRLRYAEPEPQGGYTPDAIVVWCFDEHSVTFYPLTSPEVAEALEKGALIETYEPPLQPEKQAPESVTARQFKLQLLASGLIDQVETWISAQDRATQIAYEYSGTFVRSEPMMLTGFKALGFSTSQIEDFFLAASKL